MHMYTTVGEKKALDTKLKAPDFMVKGKAFESAMQSQTPPPAVQQSSTNTTSQFPGVPSVQQSNGNSANTTTPQFPVQESNGNTTTQPWVPAAQPQESDATTETPLAVNSVKRAAQQGSSDRWVDFFPFNVSWVSFHQVGLSEHCGMKKHISSNKSVDIIHL